MKELEMKTPYDCFYALLMGLNEKYGLAGLIDIATGTGMSHLGLMQVLGELKRIAGENDSPTDEELRSELIGAYESLLLQLLHNIRADGDWLTISHLMQVRGITGYSKSPEWPEKAAINDAKFPKGEVLSIIHLAIAELET